MAFLCATARGCVLCTCYRWVLNVFSACNILPVILFLIPPKEEEDNHAAKVRGEMSCVNTIFPLRAVHVLHRIFFNNDQTGLARYKEVLKFPGSRQVTYGYRASYSRSDQIFKQRSRTGLVGFNKRFKCVENYHFSTTDYCSVKLAPAAKIIQYCL